MRLTLSGARTCRLPSLYGKEHVMLRILAYFKEYRWRVVVMLLCVAASGVLNAIWPYLSGTVLYDKVLGKNGDFASSLGFGGNFMLMLGFLVFIMTVTKLLQQITGRHSRANDRVHGSWRGL